MTSPPKNSGTNSAPTGSLISPVSPTGPSAAASSSNGNASASSSTPAPTPQRGDDGLDPVIPEDAPPSYASAIANGDLRVAAGPSRMDFSGPPPMPDHMRPMQHTPTGGSVLPGVGVGYGRVAPPHGPPPQGPPQPRWQAYPGQTPGYTPPPPPQHPNGAHYGSPGGYASPVSPGGYHSSSAHPPQRPQSTQAEDHTPTESPVPGRPLLRNGQLLVFPRGYWCYKCSNTGYKNADPSNPCSSDWRKYGKAFNSALAHSYSVTPRPGQNPSTTEATNFQRPLPAHRPAGMPQHHPPQQQYYHPPQPQVYYQGYGAPRPPGALYVQPGDPRIGGRLCNRCGGSGTEMSFSLFIFDETRCGACNGLGRVFP